jgi:hypothetical protein
MEGGSGGKKIRSGRVKKIKIKSGRREGKEIKLMSRSGRGKKN